MGCCVGQPITTPTSGSSFDVDPDPELDNFRAENKYLCEVIVISVSWTDLRSG